MTLTLLDLPLEIRLKIYTLVFRNTVITLHALKVPQPGPPAHSWATDTRRPISTQFESELSRSALGRSKLALLTLNHQIRIEAQPIFLPHVIINLHVGGIKYISDPTRKSISALFITLLSSIPIRITNQIHRLAFFIESTPLFTPTCLSQFHSLCEIHVWDWKQLCVTEADYFSEVGCGSTRHEEYNRQMAEYLYEKLNLGEKVKGLKTFFQHSVYDLTDDVLEVSGRAKGEFTHKIIREREAVISRDDMDVENLTAYPLR